MMEFIEKWRGYPKVELHTHIDCSLSYHAARFLSPTLRLKEFREDFVAPPNCHNLAAFLKCIDPAIALMQTTTALTLSTDDLIDQLAAENVRYAEIRFAPLLHTRQGLQPELITETVLEAVRSASETYGVQIGLILCTLRHYTEEQSLETAALVKRYADSGVVALDLAADEAGFPIDAHVAAFQSVRAAGLNAIAHAGEARGADSVHECVTRLNVSRIGHGVRSVEDASTIELLLEKQIHLEVCPSSNIQTNVFPTLLEHTIDRLKNLGVSVGVNTDTRTVSDITLSSEYAALEKTFGWNSSEFLNANINALNASFAPPELKSEIVKELSIAYSEPRSNDRYAEC